MAAPAPQRIRLPARRCRYEQPAGGQRRSDMQPVNNVSAHGMGEFEDRQSPREQNADDEKHQGDGK